jgi:hypothetical protein
LHDLCFIIYFRDSNGQLHHEWIDFFSEASHDWKFTFEGLMQFEHYIDLEQFQDSITFWADNGFRNHGCLYAFWFLSQMLQIPLFVNFFAPHHGFNMCDTHFGIGKQMVRQHHRQNLIEKPQDIWQIFQKIINTTVIVLEDIPDRWLPKHFFTFHQGGISQYSNFYIVPNETVLCRKDSNDEEWIEIEVCK